MRLLDKVAVITGVGSGTGRQMAILFASEGAKIVGTDYNAETLNEVVEIVKAKGGEIIGVYGDVSIQENAEGMVDSAVKNFGRLDILCNNAGVMDLNHGVGDVTNEIWKRLLSINLDGPMFTSRKAVPIMLKQNSGSIVNVASAAGLGGGPAGAAYVASKHGLVGLTRSTAWMYAKKGIRCNAICPGGVKTNIMQSVDMTKMDPEGSERTKVYAGISPHFLDAIDIAQLALFLASDESRFINGAIIPADSGWRSA